MRRAIYPGNFDPITYGHIDLVKRAVRIFDEVIIAVSAISQKNTLFTPNERKTLIERSIKGLKGVKVEIFHGLVVNYARRKKTNVMLRGLRMISDFEYEFQMTLTNRKLSQNIETMFMMPNESYSYISSRLIKEAAALGADLKAFVPTTVAVALKKKLNEATAYREKLA